MTRFEIGKTYSMRSACDHNCTWTYMVTGRTQTTITLNDGRKDIKCRVNKQISEYRDAETVFPLGRYSMSPVLSAN